MRRPTLRDFVIPLGMAGGAFAGLLIAMIDVPSGEAVRAAHSGDAGHGSALLAMFYMLIGTAVGAVVGIVVAVALYLGKRRQAKLR